MAYAIIYSVAVLALTAVAIYVQVTASNLSLPIPKATSILVIFLPWIAAGIDFSTRFKVSLHGKNSRRSRHASSLLDRLGIRGLVPALHAIQYILTIVLATNLSHTMTTGSMSNCLLQTNWQRMWSAHDRRGIERIQDAFKCCGFNSVKDRAWPKDTCPALYGRTNSCRQSWEAALRAGSGLDFAVCLIVGLFQLWQLMQFSYPSGQTSVRRRIEEWRQLPQDEASQSAENNRLLEEQDSENEDLEDNATPSQVRNGGRPEDRNEPTRPSQSNRQGSYGAIENGERPAILPSGLGNESNAWH